MFAIFIYKSNGVLKLRPSDYVVFYVSNTVSYSVLFHTFAALHYFALHAVTFSLISELLNVNLPFFFGNSQK